MVLTQAETKNAVELGLALRQLNVNHNVGLGLLVYQPEIAVALDMPQLGLEGIALYMSGRNTTMLHTWQHDIIAIR